MSINITKSNGIQYFLDSNPNFKFGYIKITFIDSICNVNLAARAVLVSMMNECSLKYPTNRDIKICEENLYGLSLRSSCKFVGDYHESIFNFSFLESQYVNEDDYLDKVFDFIKEIILNPLFINNLCNEDIFIKCKNEFIENFKSINDTPNNFIRDDIKKKVYKGTRLEKYHYGSLEELESLTREDVYEEYLKLLNTKNLEVRSASNIPNNYLINNINNIFKDYSYDTSNHESLMHHKYIKNLDYKSKFKTKQNILVLFYTFDNKAYSRKERFIICHLFNSVLGSLGLDDMLSNKLRMENKLVYHVGSVISFDSHVLRINTYLNKDNVNKAKELIFKVIEDMKNGNIPTKLLDMAISREISDVYSSKDNVSYHINEEVNMYKYNDYSNEEYIEELHKVTINDLKEFAIKLSLFAIYELEGEE